LGGTSAETAVAARKIKTSKMFTAFGTQRMCAQAFHITSRGISFSQSQESGVAGPPQPSIRVISVQATRVDAMGHGRIVFSGSPHVLKANADVRLRWLEASGAASSSEQG
jgi:hypothetical protein